MKPELKQFGELTAEDFDRHPAWINCHVEDYGEPWYDETDEETFRPWSRELPVSAADGMLLVKAVATLADGSLLPGFVTPAAGTDLGLVQPQVFAGGRMFSFWGGVMGIAQQYRDEFYKAVGKGADAVFPIRFAVAAGLVRDATDVVVNGFHCTGRGGTVVVER